MSQPDPMPSDDVLLELGRVGYAAIELEPIIDWICRLIQGPGGQEDKGPIGARITSVRKILEGNRAIPERERTLDWLCRADEAMERRNAVFHGDPGVDWNVYDDAQMGAGELLLMHKSRRAHERVTVTPLTVGGLREVLLALEGVLAEWQEVFRPIGAWRLDENARLRAQAPE